MSENTAFKTHASSQGEPSLYWDSDNLVFRFNSQLPTEYTYRTGTPSPERTFFKYSSKHEHNMLTALEEAGAGLEEAKKLVSEFDDKAYAEFKEYKKIMEQKEKILFEQLTKVAEALSNITKSKLIEHVHQSNDEIEKAKKRVEQIANQMIKKYKAKA